jgi:hypothetical protein
MNDYPLFTVVVVALVCMMCVQIFGVYWTYFFPSTKTASYECDFQMKNHVITMPCEIRNVTFSSN